jgi:hypothetical protein
LKSDGTVAAWGGNSAIPSGLSGVVAIAAGGINSPRHSMALKSDGTVMAWGSNTSGQTTIPTGLIGVVAIAAGGSHSMALKIDGISFINNLPNGDVLLASETGKLRHYARTFRTILPESPNAIPLPVVLSTTQRPGTGLVDIDFRVDDADDATVEVAALAFRNGGNTLADVIPIKTLVEGTANKVGAGVATGQVHRITWDARADVSGDFEQVQIEILAKDGRGLLNLDYIQIPAGMAKPRLEISKTPLKDADFYTAWLWLIAIGATDVDFENGRILSSQGQVVVNSGLKAEYFANSDFTGQSVVRIAESISFAGYSGERVEIVEGVVFGIYSIRWEGDFLPKKSGEYSLSYRVAQRQIEWWEVDSPGWIHVGVNVWIDGKKVIHENSPNSFYVSAVADKAVPIVIEYADYGGDWRSFFLTVSPPGEWLRGANGSDFQTVDSYASGSSTTAAGRAFLLARMGLREATPQEILRAQEAGTPGVINQWTPPLQVGPGERPLKVNAYGFETGDTGTWVVPISSGTP